MPRKTYTREALLALNTEQCQQPVANLPHELLKKPKTNTFWAPDTCRPVSDKGYKDDLDKSPPAILCK